MGIKPINVQRECPMCFGKGEVLTSEEQKGHSMCMVCKGAGRVNPFIVCECGKPGILFDEKNRVSFCGSLGCLEAKLRRLSNSASAPGWD